MKISKTFFKYSFLVIFSIGINANIPEGAFTTLHVKAKDLDAYVDYMKNNSTAFEQIGSDVAGVCVTKTGNQYAGEMFVWNAYPSIEMAFQSSEKYDPFKATDEFKKLREVMYSVTWKPLKEFDLRPGYERLWRINLSDPMAFTQMMTKLENELESAGHDMRIGVFQPMGGGTETFHLRAVSNNASDSGKVADGYFAGASYGKTWDEAFANYVTEVVSETTEFCEVVYTKS